MIDRSDSATSDGVEAVVDLDLALSDAGVGVPREEDMELELGVAVEPMDIGDQTVDVDVDWNDGGAVIVEMDSTDTDGEGDGDKDTTEEGGAGGHDPNSVSVSVSTSVSVSEPEPDSDSGSHSLGLGLEKYECSGSSKDLWPGESESKCSTKCDSSQPFLLDLALVVVPWLQAMRLAIGSECLRERGGARGDWNSEGFQVSLRLLSETSLRSIAGLSWMLNSETRDFDFILKRYFGLVVVTKACFGILGSSVNLTFIDFERVVEDLFSLCADIGRSTRRDGPPPWTR